MLPTISVSTKHAKPRTRPIAATATPSATSPVPSTPPSGAPNIAAGPATVPSMASQMTVSGADLNARPVARPGEIVEAAPGLIVTQHSGEGKANQYFLRGYNLDHGTDLAITVDDVPVNMRTHAHGQGYADLNWLMPETINALEVRKGPYFADEGDFSLVGSVGGVEVGVRSKIIPDLDTSLSVFLLDRDSEILLFGEVGDTSASQARGRYGFEWTNHRRPKSWIDIDGVVTMTHAHFRGYEVSRRRSMPR